MKTLRLLIAAVFGFAVLAPVTASADHGRSSSSSCRTSHCSRCGGDIRWVYTCVGRDRHGCPVYRWVQQRHSCPPPRCDDGHGHGRDGGRGYYDDRGSRYDDRRSGSRYGFSLRIGR